MDIFYPLTEFVPYQENNLHWAAFINGKFVNLGIDEVIVYANDDVLWALKNWDDEDILK